jgi:hypothetical protein
MSGTAWLAERLEKRRKPIARRGLMPEGQTSVVQQDIGLWSL